MGKVFCMVLILCLVPMPVPADISLPLPDSRYWSNYPRHTVSLLSSPLQWEGKQWLQMVGVAGITLGLYAVDAIVLEQVQNHCPQVLGNALHHLEFFGDGLYTLPALGGLYLYGYVQEDVLAAETALLAVESFFVAGFFSELMKHTAQRHRPRHTDSPYDFDGPLGSRDNLSFPSGHATVAFAVATVLAEQYSHKQGFSSFMYGLAALTALSRVVKNAHWPSDVFFGSVLGYTTARGILALNQEGEEEVILFQPSISGWSMGLEFSF